MIIDYLIIYKVDKKIIFKFVYNKYIYSYNKIASGRKWWKVVNNMFFGKFYHNLDEKSRLMIPRKMREQINGRLYLLRGFDGCLSVYQESSFNDYVNSLNSLPFTQKTTRDMQRLGLSSVVELEIDKQGRIQIPAQTIIEFHISRSVVVVGVVNHFEIWNKESWDKYEEDNAKKYEETAEKLPL